MGLHPLEEGYAYIFEGEMDFSLKYDNYPGVTETVNIRIKIPCRYPHDPIKVFETAGVFPNHPNYHVNDDGSMCLGSFLQLRLWAKQKGDLMAFTDDFIKPFVYAAILKVKHGVDWVFGCLSHYGKGELEHCESLFSVSGKVAVLQCLTAARRKRSVGNKLDCFCGCGKRIGRCDCHYSINIVRKATGRDFMESMIERIKST